MSKHRLNRGGKQGRLSARVLADMVRRIVKAARPEKIVLFGSAARGEMGPNSDVDFLVVKSANSIVDVSRSRSMKVFMEQKRRPMSSWRHPKRLPNTTMSLVW